MPNQRYNHSYQTYHRHSPIPGGSAEFIASSLTLLSISEDKQLDSSSSSLSQSSLLSNGSCNGLMSKGHWGNISHKRDLFALGNDDETSSPTSGCKSNLDYLDSSDFRHPQKRQRSLILERSMDGQQTDDEYEQFVDTSDESSSSAWGFYA